MNNQERTIFKNNITKLQKCSAQIMLQAMHELDDVWEQFLAEALKNPTAVKSEGLADFLAVKAANDAIREQSVKKLFDAIQSLAAHANRREAGITVESNDSHRFTIDRTTLGGSLLRFRQGIRCLTIEAGWTRTPRDGFMRGQALAVARLTHFGRSQSNAELRLLKFEDEVRWFTFQKTGQLISFELEDLIDHFKIFLT